MNHGLTRQEQWALLAMIGVILTGLGYQTWTRREADEIRVEGQGRWQKVAEFDAGDPARALVGPPRLAGTTSTTPVTSDPAGEPLARGAIDINTAGAAELERLPGIGPAKAAAIVETRERLGGFATVDQLVEVHGIGPRTLEKLRPFVHMGAVEPSAPSMPASATPTPPTLGGHTIRAAPPGAPSPAAHRVASPPGRVNINTASSAELQQLKGIGPVLADRIIAWRQTHGPFRRAEDLQQVKGIGPVTLDRLRPHIETGN